MLTWSQSLIKRSLSIRPNSNLQVQIRSLQNFHCTKIIALIEGEDWNAIGMPADQFVNNSQHRHTHKEKHTFVPGYGGNWNYETGDRCLHCKHREVERLPLIRLCLEPRVSSLPVASTIWRFHPYCSIITTYLVVR